MKIKIIGVPPGQAPEWVRKEWVGLTLETKDVPQKPISTVAARTQGDETIVVGVSITPVQTGALGGRPQNLGGYAVNAKKAVEILEGKSPEAAKWWKKNPLIKIMPYLVFSKEVCEIVE